MPQSFRHRNQEFFTAEKACRIKNFDIIHNSFVFGPDIIWWSVYILPQGVDPLPHIWDFASNPTGLYYFDDKLANKRIAYGRWCALDNLDRQGVFPMRWKIGDFDMKANEQLVLIINQSIVSTLPDFTVDFVEFHFDELIE